MNAHRTPRFTALAASMLLIAVSPLVAAFQGPPTSQPGLPAMQTAGSVETASSIPPTTADKDAADSNHPALVSVGKESQVETLAGESGVGAGQREDQGETRGSDPEVQKDPDLNAISKGHLSSSVVAGSGAASSFSTSPDSLGNIAASGYAPPGIDFQAPAGVPSASQVGAIGAPSNYAAGPGCMVSCITSGLAYPRGFGAELVVKTTVAAQVWLLVTADTNGDGQIGAGDLAESVVSGGHGTQFSAAFDDLTPATLHFVTVVAEDSDGHTDHRYGEFTTLAERVATLALGDLHLTSAWGDGSDAAVQVELDDSGMGAVGPGVTFEGLGATIDLAVRVHQSAEEELGLLADCGEAWAAGPGGPDFGYFEHSCMVWNTARATGVPTDIAPAATRWSATGFAVQLETPSNLPAMFPGFTVTVWVTVEYR